MKKLAAKKQKLKEENQGIRMRGTFHCGCCAEKMDKDLEGLYKGGKRHTTAYLWDRMKRMTVFRDTKSLENKFVHGKCASKVKSLTKDYVPSSQPSDELISEDSPVDDGNENFSPTDKLKSVPESFRVPKNKIHPKDDESVVNPKKIRKANVSKRDRDRNFIQ